MAQKKDLEDILFWLLNKTLLLWLLPYIFWYFGKQIFEATYKWVTEPLREP